MKERIVLGENDNMGEQRTTQFAENNKSIQNLIGKILQQGEIFISDDNTLSWKIRVLKGEIILIETDYLATDPMEREETFSNLHALDLLYDNAKANNFFIPFDREQLLEPDKRILTEAEEIIGRIFLRMQTQEIEEDER